MSLMDVGLIVGGGYAISLLLERTGITEYLYSLLQDHRSSFNDEYELVIGYKLNLLKRQQIRVNMKSTPHVLVCGLSGSGKSRMVENAVKDKQVILLNAFEDDFTSIKGRRINGNDKILNCLELLVKEPYKREKPIYVVIDELLVLCMDKKVNKAIADLLAVGRHYNIFVIGISQRGEKTELPYKNLFNARVCFRQVEESSYRAILGYSPEDKQLKHREFYLYSDVLARGRTYDL